MSARLSVALCVLLLGLLPGRWAGAVEIRVAAASSLQFALPEIIEEFHRSGLQRVRISYGASGLFARQIARGAPFDLFLSANEAYVKTLVRAGLTRGDGAVYAIGRLVLFVPGRSAIDPRITLERLPGEVAAGRLKRFALAHPEHTPYGLAARQALEQRAAWDGIAPARVYGESVAQAARFLTSGAADAGLIARSLAIQPQVAKHGRARLVDEALHAPLRQRMVLIDGGRPEAEAFYDYLRGDSAAAVFASHGFTVPE